MHNNGARSISESMTAQEMLNLFELCSVHEVFVHNQKGFSILSWNFMNVHLNAVFEEPAHLWASRQPASPTRDVQSNLCQLELGKETRQI